MDSKEKKRYLMEQGPVPKSLIKLGVPTMVGMLTSALYNIVDTYFVGTLGTSQTAAVSVAFPISIILLAIGLLFGAGASSYLARKLGNKEYNEANRCASTALSFSMLTGIIVISLMLLFINPLLRLLGATDTILPYAKQYAIPFIIGLIFNVFNITINNMIASEGATLYSMIAMISGGIVNIILDPILILKLNMGVAGAAVATLVSRVISFAIYIYYINSGKSMIKFSFKYIYPHSYLFKEIFKIGVPMLMYQILCSIALALTNSQAKRFGDSAVAGMGVAGRILQIGSVVVIGFLKGYQPFIGYNYGAKKFDRAKQATKCVILWSSIFCIVVGSLCIFARNPIMHAFTKDDTDMISIGAKSLIFNGITFLGMGYIMTYDFLFMGLGRAKEGGIISISRQGLFFIPLIIILPMLLGINGIIIAQPVADILTMIMVLFMIHGKTYIPSDSPKVIQEV